MSFPHLHKRSNGFYYFRIRVPADLVDKVPAREIIKSLKTKDRTTAKSLVRSWQYRVDKAFMLFRSGFLSHEQELELRELLLHRKVRHGQTTTLRLNEVMEEYEKEHGRNWRPKTKMEFEGSCRIVVAVMGNTGIKDITRNSVKELRDKLLRLPANMFKKAEYIGMSVREILELKDVRPMSVSSVNKHLAWLSSVLKFSVREGYILANIAEGLQVKQDTRPDEERKVYENQELQNIVEWIRWDAKHPERYWIPLIAMFSGMRINEICQLYTEDIKEMNGCWCIDINENTPDKKLKNKFSRRIIPVHPTLIGMGFLKYVESLRHLGIPRLWMALKWREADGYYNAFGKWAQRFNKEHITKDPGKVMYSLRHSFANTLKQQGAQESIIAELMGHSNPSITIGRYGKRYEMEKLFEAIKMLDYGIVIKLQDSHS